MQDCRCKKCRKLLFKIRSGVIIENESVLEIKCSRCSDVNYFYLVDIFREHHQPVDVIS